MRVEEIAIHATSLAGVRERECDGHPDAVRRAVTQAWELQCD